ncbi:MAG: aspartate/glutamate racemase family protein [Desulfovibrionales bacterium]|nr:aspartate/glutamate racemase family protein [Desulfovibrionales bacterium]
MYFAAPPDLSSQAHEPTAAPSGREKIVGILGGMGPESTVDLMNRVIKATTAKDDIDHIRMLVDNNPKVPSRIRALIEKTGESPLGCLQDMARRLEKWGVDFLAIPCNTAHYYHQGVQQAVSIPLLDMIGLSVNAITSEVPDLKTVGLLASSAVFDLGLYNERFADAGVRLMDMEPGEQGVVMSAIRKIKTSSYGPEVVEAIQNVVDNLARRGAQVILVACTELSIIGGQITPATRMFDAAQILAEAIVREAKS